MRSILDARAFDVTDEAAFRGLDAAGIAIDILFDNARIQHRQLLVDLSLADWQRVIGTNLTGAFLLGRTVAKRSSTSDR